MILASPGIVFVPMIGVFLAIGAFLVGIGLLFQFAVWMSGPCPCCHAVQTVWVPTEACRWRRVRRRSTGYVSGADCVVCRNRMIIRIDDRIAIPAPSVVRVLPGAAR